jgi:hypothetical protein
MTVAAAAGLVGVGSACEVKTPRPSPTPEGLGGTPTEVLPTATATSRATETKTSTPTEKPLFTEAEVEKANPFDLSTWPDRFKTTQEHPETATEQQWQDEYNFLLAARENKGIPKTAEYKDHINQNLQSLWNGVKWMQEHPDQVKAEQLKLIISPVEYRAMIEEPRVITKWRDTDGAAYGGLDPVNFLQNYGSENIGSILGKDINTKRHPFDTVYGKLAGFGEIGDQNVILIDMKDTDGYHVLFPAVVYVEEGVTLPKGSKFLVEDKNYSNKHNGSSSFTSTEDISLSPLRSVAGGKIVSWGDLYDGFGKMIYIYGGYGNEITTIVGTSAKCFSPILNLEIASAIMNMAQEGNSSPWSEQ